MYETIDGAQAKVNRHAAGPHPTATAGKPGGVLPAGTDQFALVYNAGTGTWEPAAISGSGAAASKADPLNLGFPYNIDPRLLAAQAASNQANRTFYYRASGGGTVNKIGLYVNTASGNICVSVYANTGAGRSAAPGAQVATSGSLACPAAGYAEIALGGPVTVTTGDFWFAIALDNTVAQISAASTLSVNIQGVMAWQDTAFPSPATATPVNGSGAGGSPRLFGLIGAP